MGWMKITKIGKYFGPSVRILDDSYTTVVL